MHYDQTAFLLKDIGQVGSHSPSEYLQHLAEWKFASTCHFCTINCTICTRCKWLVNIYKGENTWPPGAFQNVDSCRIKATQVQSIMHIHCRTRYPKDFQHLCKKISITDKSISSYGHKHYVRCCLYKVPPVCRDGPCTEMEDFGWNELKHQGRVCLHESAAALKVHLQKNCSVICRTQQTFIHFFKIYLFLLWNFTSGRLYTDM